MGEYAMKQSPWLKIHHGRIWGVYPNENCMRFLMKYFGKTPMVDRHNIKILDIGVGAGANFWMLLNEGFDAYGIDISPDAIHNANSLINHFGFPCSPNLILGDIRISQYGFCQFDAVIDCATIMHTDKHGHIAAFQNVYNYLKPGGLFWMHHIAIGSEHISTDFGETVYASQTDLSRFARKCGFIREFVGLDRRDTLDGKVMLFWNCIFRKPDMVLP